MAKLDLYTGREPHIVELDVKGEKKEFRLPTDYTEEEVERLLELGEKLEGSDDLMTKRALLFAQVHILFARYQPDMTLEQVKAMLTWDDALKVINFISQHTAALTKSGPEGEAGGKKKQHQKS